MTLTETFHAPLEALWLCAECGSVTNRSERCPSCANEHGLINLSSILNRESSAISQLEEQ